MKFAFSIVIVVLDPTSFKFLSDLILESDVEKSLAFSKYGIANYKLVFNFSKLP